MNILKEYTHVGVSKNIPDEALIEALASLFNLPLSQIALTRDDNWWKVEWDTTDVLCRLFNREGDFPLIIELILFNKQLAYPDSIEQLGNLAASLQGKILVEDLSTLSPLSWIVVNKDKKIYKVLVNAERLNEFDEYLIEVEVEMENLG